MLAYQSLCSGRDRHAQSCLSEWSVRVKSNENVTEGEWLRQMKMLLSDAGTSQGGPARERGRLDLSPRRSSLFGLRPAPFFAYAALSRWGIAPSHRAANPAYISSRNWRGLVCSY